MTLSSPIRRLASYLAQLEIWLVSLAIALSFISSSFLPAAVVTAAFFWLVRWVAYRRVSVRTPGDLSVILLLITIPITLWATTLIDKTLLQVYRLISGIAFYYAIANWANSAKRVQLLVKAMLLAGLSLALFSAISVQWAIYKLPFIPPSFYERFAVLVSDTVHPNVMGGTLAILLPIALAWLLFGWGKLGLGECVLAGIATTVMGGILVLTQSRGAIMALGAALVMMTMLRWRRGWTILILAVISAVMVAYWLGITRAVDLIVSSNIVGGIDGRLEVWSRAIYMVQDFPFTGVGMGTFTEVADRLYPLVLTSSGSIIHAHNQFLQIAVDLGLPGLIAWLATLMVVTTICWQLYRSGKLIGDTQCAALGAGLLCSQLALVIHGITDAVTWGVRSAPIAWALWGIVIAAYQLNAKPLPDKAD